MAQVAQLWKPRFIHLLWTAIDQERYFHWAPAESFRVLRIRSSDSFGQHWEGLVLDHICWFIFVPMCPMGMSQKQSQHMERYWTHLGGGNYGTFEMTKTLQKPRKSNEKHLFSTQLTTFHAFIARSKSVLEPLEHLAVEFLSSHVGGPQTGRRLGLESGWVGLVASLLLLVVILLGDELHLRLTTNQQFQSTISGLRDSLSPFYAGQVFVDVIVMYIYHVSIPSLN